MGMIGETDRPEDEPRSRNALVTFLTNSSLVLFGQRILFLLFVRSLPFEFPSIGNLIDEAALPFHLPAFMWLHAPAHAI